MNLQYFPMDRQLCHIEIESCKYEPRFSPLTPITWWIKNNTFLLNQFAVKIIIYLTWFFMKLYLFHESCKARFSGRGTEVIHFYTYSMPDAGMLRYAPKIIANKEWVKLYVRRELINSEWLCNVKCYLNTYFFIM